MVQKPYQFGQWQGCDDFQSKEKDSIVSIEVRVVEASMEAGSSSFLCIYKIAPPKLVWKEYENIGKKKKGQKWGSGVYVDNRIDFPDPKHSNTFVAWTIIEKAFSSESTPKKNDKIGYKLYSWISLKEPENEVSFLTWRTPND